MNAKSDTRVERVHLVESAKANSALVELSLPVGAVQLLYDVLGHFPHAPGTWSQDARTRCSIALYDARGLISSIQESSNT